jgi:lipoate-protein ligase A
MGRAVSTLTIWWDTAADGPTNMAADECLAAEAERRGSLVLRFYGWSDTTISLGGFQKIGDARQVEAIRGVPLVRRPSGGGAIVHGSDLTYAAAVPKSHPWGASPQVFYDALHGARVEVLAELGIHSRTPTEERERKLSVAWSRENARMQAITDAARREVMRRRMELIQRIRDLYRELDQHG